MINIRTTDRTCIRVGISSINGDNSWKENRWELGNKFYIHGNFKWCRSPKARVQNNKMTRIKTGDIMSITLDLVDKYVSFHNSRTKVSQKVNIEGDDGDAEYRLVVGITQANVAVSIEKFQQNIHVDVMASS